MLVEVERKGDLSLLKLTYSSRKRVRLVNGEKISKNYLLSRNNH